MVPVAQFDTYIVNNNLMCICDPKYCYHLVNVIADIVIV